MLANPNTPISNVTQLSEHVKDRLRQIDREAAEAYIATLALSTAVQASAVRPKLALVGGDKAALSVADCAALVHHATTSEAAARRVSMAVSEVALAAERLPSGSGAPDPIISDVRHYQRTRRMMEREALTDGEAARLHAEALAPFSGDIPPMIRSAKGAAEVLKMLASFSHLDHVDRNCVAAVVAYLEWRS